MEDIELVQQALDARKHAYAPYSKYFVGAALIAKNSAGQEKIFKGCNIENSSYPCGICAERVAASKAISEGFVHFEKIAIAGSSKSICTPCGVCRQFLFEFNENLPVLCSSCDGSYEIHILKDLLTLGFGPSSMK